MDLSCLFFIFQGRGLKPTGIMNVTILFVILAIGTFVSLLISIYERFQNNRETVTQVENYIRDKGNKT